MLANYDKTTGMWWATGDVTGDGRVDINDLSLVLTNYDKSLVGAAAAGAAAVPEPSCIALLAGAVVLLVVARWR